MFRDLRLPERFWSKVVVDADCWRWTGAIAANGYGQIRVDGRTVLAHRFAYRALVGEPPEGLELDHLCRVRSCCNPAHLEPVTRSVNQLRGARWAEPVTHCVAGHSYEGANLRIEPSTGRKRCRTCEAARYQARKAVAHV